MLIHPYTLLAAGALLLASIYYLLFVPPAKLYSNFNSVPVIKSRFPGLGAVGFFANRYTLCVRSTSSTLCVPILTPVAPALTASLAQQQQTRVIRTTASTSSPC